MSILTRIEKVEKELDKKNIGTNQPQACFLYRRDAEGNEYYKLHRDDGDIWITKEELDQYLAPFKGDGKGPIIFMPLEYTE